MSTLDRDIPYFTELSCNGRARLHAGARRAVELQSARLTIDPAVIAAAAYEDPRLHAWFYAPETDLPLMQLLAGYLSREHLPSTIEVVADEEGVVHVPHVGRWSGLAGRERAAIEWRDAWVLHRTQGSSEFLPTRKIGDFGVELMTALDPLTQHVLLQGAARGGSLHVAECARRHTRALTGALIRLSQLDIGYAEELARDGRVLCLFKNTQIPSCANVSAYGAAFLQCEDDASEVFFCEDIAHQVGHVTFYSVTADPRRCFRIPPQTPLRLCTYDQTDARSLFDAFHGNFTMVRMVQVFDALMGMSWSALEYHELRGRFALALHRLEYGLASVDDERLFSPEAWAMHAWFWELYAEMKRRRGPVLAGADLGEQPYVFSWEIYRRRNGLDVPSALRRSG